MIIKNHSHKKGFALGLVLKQRLAASRKWPIHDIQEIKTCFSYIVELYKHLEFFKNTSEVPTCFSSTSLVFLKIPSAFITQQCTRGVYFFNKIKVEFQIVSDLRVTIKV